MNSKDYEIRWPSQEKADNLKTYIDKILKAIGVKRAFISDLSSIGDFEPLWSFQCDSDDPDEIELIINREIALVAQRLNLEELTSKDKIIDIAQKLKDKNEN